MTTPDPADVGVLAALMGYLRSDVNELSKQIDRLGESFVLRGEWLVRNADVDRTHVNLGREIGQLRSQLDARHTPWPSVVSAVCAIIAAAVALVAVLT